MRGRNGGVWVSRKAPGTYATAYDALRETSPKLTIVVKRNAMVALRGIHVACFVFHVLQRAFGDASLKTW